MVRNRSEKGRKVVVALGGNAILKHKGSGSAEDQLRNIRDTSLVMVQLVKLGYHIIITHGNGPQVGDILLKNELAKDQLPPMPLDICGAESQGMIGYMLQQSLRNELKLGGIDRKVATVLTQTMVDKDDKAFKNPNKPIGPFYTAMEAKNLMAEKGWIVINNAGSGYRRVVPSPEPKAILEGDIIKTLVDEGFFVISSGGGGVPVVIDKAGVIKGVEAVIDKDHSAALLAHIVDAATLLILTDVDNVYLNYEKPDQKPIERISLKEAKKYLKEGHFSKGSMYPKIESAIRFLDSGGDTSIITSPEKAIEGMLGKAGTIINI